MNSLFDNWTSNLKKNSLLMIMAILLPTVVINTVIMTAERICATFSAMETSISVTALQKYAEDGVIDNEL